MAVRGKVKNVKDTGGSLYTGTVTDTKNNVDYPYSSILGKELGIIPNMIVRMEIITASDGTQMAVSLDPVEKGTVLTVDAATNSGTLKDNAGNTVKFIQDYLTELNINPNDRVNYCMVMNQGTYVATALQK